jgi:mannitol operon repressor
MEPSEQHNYQLYLAEIQKETDRGAVLLAVSLIDYHLGEIIKAFLINRPQNKILFSPNSALGSVDSRISFAYALGLINDDEYHDYNILIRIRNKFAHKIDLDLSLERNDIVQQLSILKNNIFRMGDRPNGKRAEFNLVITIMVIRLDGRIQEVSKKRLVQGKWTTLDDLEYAFVPDDKPE